LVRGADCDRNPHYRFERYEDAEHVVALTNEFLEKVILRCA
jgi:hypothetical protein